MTVISNGLALSIDLHDKMLKVASKLKADTVEIKVTNHISWVIVDMFENNDCICRDYEIEILPF